jgi:hypothetical protein
MPLTSGFPLHKIDWRGKNISIWLGEMPRNEVFLRIRRGCNFGKLSHAYSVKHFEVARQHMHQSRSFAPRPPQDFFSWLQYTVRFFFVSDELHLLLFSASDSRNSLWRKKKKGSFRSSTFAQLGSSPYTTRIIYVSEDDSAGFFLEILTCLCCRDTATLEIFHWNSCRTYVIFASFLQKHLFNLSVCNLEYKDPPMMLLCVRFLSTA